MNERIKQLAEQACAFADIQYNKQTKATFYTNKSVEEFFREKFAELIVRDVVEQIITRERTDGEWYQDDIFKHFGVEE